MKGKTKPTLIERLSLVYPDQYEIVRTASGIHSDVAVFSSKNKRFGNIEISGGLHQWQDEDDYDDEAEEYEKIGADYQDYREDISSYFRTKCCTYLLTPTEIFEYLDKILADQMNLYCVSFLPSRRKKNGLYEKEVFEKMVADGKIRIGNNYKLCLWSGNFPFKQKR